MSSLGINVGHTGGSMLAEAMIAMRGIGTARTFAGRGGSGGSSSGSGGGNTFMKGGLSGVVSRKVTNTAINNANGSKAAVSAVWHSIPRSVRAAVLPTA